MRTRQRWIIAGVVCLLACPAGADPITSPVGTGQAGDRGDGGPAVKAQLNQPFDLIFDQAGNLYVSDTANHRVRRVDAASGVITTVAGNGQRGFSGDGGTATAATLNEPYGLALDENRGWLFIADRLNRRVRRIDLNSGQISTIAGNGQANSSGDGGLATAAGIVEPNDVAIDNAGGRLFIADVAGHRVRAVDLATGRITTFTGNGQGRGEAGPADGSLTLPGPRALAMDRDRLLVLLRNGNRLYACPLDGSTPRNLAGTGAKGYEGDGGPAAQASFNGPKELALDAAGNILIVDTENQVIRRIDRETGLIRTIAGNGQAGGGGDGGPATSAQLDRPHGVAVAPDGSVWIGDTNNHRLRRFQP